MIVALTVIGFGFGWVQPIPAQTSQPTQPGTRLTSRTLTKEPIKRYFESKHQPGDQPLYTSRPLLAVGVIKEMDRATSSVLLTIDRERSQMPNILMHRAKKAGKENELLDREFPAERRFSLSPRTMFLDARESQKKEAVRAETGKMAEDAQQLEWSDFAPGDHATVLYKLRPNPDQPPLVITVSKVDPDQKDFEADFNPSGHKRLYRHVYTGPDGTTTGTRIIVKPNQSTP